MNMKNLILAICMVLTFGVSAQQKYSSNEYYGREYRDNGDTLKYRILYPPGMMQELNSLCSYFCTERMKKGMTMSSN